MDLNPELRKVLNGGYINIDRFQITEVKEDIQLGINGFTALRSELSSNATRAIQIFLTL